MVVPKGFIFRMFNCSLFVTRCRNVSILGFKLRPFSINNWYVKHLSDPLIQLWKLVQLKVVHWIKSDQKTQNPLLGIIFIHGLRTGVLWIIYVYPVYTITSLEMFLYLEHIFMFFYLKMYLIIDMPTYYYINNVEYKVKI